MCMSCVSLLTGASTAAGMGLPHTGTVQHSGFSSLLLSQTEGITVLQDSGDRLWSHLFSEPRPGMGL